MSWSVAYVQITSRRLRKNARLRFSIGIVRIDQEALGGHEARLQRCRHNRFWRLFFKISAKFNIKLHASRILRDCQPTRPTVSEHHQYSPPILTIRTTEMKILLAFIFLGGSPCIAQQQYKQPPKQNLQPATQQPAKPKTQLTKPQLPLQPPPAASYIIKKREQSNSMFNPANPNRSHTDMHGRTGEDRESRTQDQYILQRLPDGILPPGTTVFVPSTKKKRP